MGRTGYGFARRAGARRVRTTGSYGAGLLVRDVVVVHVDLGRAADVDARADDFAAVIQERLHVVQAEIAIVGRHVDMPGRIGFDGRVVGDQIVFPRVGLVGRYVQV